ncbi:MAG: ribosome maturation factor RimM [Acidobacteriota bacterium]
MGWDDLILVGVVARAHGNRGEVIVNLETDFPELRFRPSATLQAARPGHAPRPLRIRAVRFHQGRPVLTLEGVESMDDAEALAGAELRVPPDDQAALPPGSYYHHQLVGCEVVTEAGERVGRVAAVEGDAAATRLSVRGARSEVLIPLADAICRVDVAARRIVVTPPPGLLELNGDWRES